MKIEVSSEHVAIWTRDLERIKALYRRYFAASANDGYFNPRREFSSYVLPFFSGARNELTKVPERLDPADGPRVTGDGYYESVVPDPDGNRVELTV
ncbi:MAG: VOC family protein [Candidatus Binataceae bacterium]